MADASRRLVVGLAGLALLAAGCGDEDPHLLSSDDLPSEVSSSETGHAGFPAVGNCSAVNDAQGRASTDAWAADGFQYWIFSLKSGDAVSATVMDFADETAAQAALADIADERDTCAADSSVGIVVEPLDDVPDGAVGYRVTTPTSNGDQTGVFVVAPTGEGDRLISVGASRLHGEEPEVDVNELLATAEDRAADLTDLPTIDDATDE